MRRVVVTGMGMVTPLGCGVEHTWARLIAGESGAKAIDTFDVSDIACKIKNPKASRAVGAAIGRNPVSFVVPCHRALGKSGALTGYHWGITRKQAMLGWEAGQVGLH